jgi:hypothetical protein
MGQTRVELKRQQKKQARANEIRKNRNIQRNNPDKRYRLDVLIDGEWKEGVRHWSYRHQIEAHKTDTEKRRQAGEEIVPGRVIDTKLGELILNIAGSKPKGTAPDKIADGVKAADLEVEPTVESDRGPDKEAVEPVEETQKKKSLFSRILKKNR